MRTTAPDNTAEIASNAGALVHERTHPTKKSKGYALDWMFDRLFKQEKQYDAICVFDADNLVHPQFLMEMNNRLCKGDKVIQGYMDAKNPYDTWVSGTFAIAFWVICHISHLAKSNIGLSACLGGTGMCFDTEILKRHGWQATCLTEDMEFTMKCMAEGIKTSWAHDAIIYDEETLTFKLDPGTSDVAGHRGSSMSATALFRKCWWQAGSTRTSACGTNASI